MTTDGTESVEPSATYTRTGDDGTTTLGDGSRTGKADLRIVAYGETEEASAAIGLTIALGSSLTDPVIILLSRVQNDLLDLGADLCAPVDPTAGSPSPAVRIDDGYVARLERACDHFNQGLPGLASFVVPGGTTTAAMLHQARTVVRRAERSTAEAVRECGDTMNPTVGAYLNRLSSLLFILARSENAEHSDTLWQPGLSTSCSDFELWERH